MSGTALREALEPTQLLAQRVIELLPTIAIVLLLLAMGLVASIILASLTRWVVRRSGLEAVAERIDAHRVLQNLGIRQSVSVVLGRLALLVGLLITFFTASEAAGLTVVARAITAVVGYLPRAVAALLILIAGVWASDLTRRIILRVTRRQSVLESPEVVAELARYAVVVVTLTLSADQLGLETGLVNAVIQILFGAVALGLALAFALGARSTLGNIIARHYAVRLFRPGDEIRLDDVNGGILVSHGPTGVNLRAGRGEIVIPYTLLMANAVQLDRAVEPELFTSEEEDL